jgi:hypothetical protein
MDKVTMSRRLYISVWTPTVDYSLLLYIIHFEHMTKDDVDGIMGIMEHDFLDPLLDRKLVRLKQTLRNLEVFLAEAATVDLATHWWRCASDVNVGSERTIINMKEPTIVFDLVNNGVFTKVFMNTEESFDNLRKVLE